MSVPDAKALDFRDIDALSADTRVLTSASDRIDQAFALMGSPYRLSELIVALGRNRPATMEVESIDSLETGIVMRGTLHETSDRAKITLDQCRQQMLADPLIGARFGSIGLTSFSRKDRTDTFEFELTFRLKGGKP